MLQETKIKIPPKKAKDGRSHGGLHFYYLSNPFMLVRKLVDRNILLNKLFFYLDWRCGFWGPFIPRGLLFHIDCDGLHILPTVLTPNKAILAEEAGLIMRNPLKI